MLIGSALAEDQAVTTTPAIAGVVAAGTPIELIKDGFTGTEGPIAYANNSLLFTENQANRVTQIAADGSTSSFLDNTNGVNALAFSADGVLYAVQTLQTRVGIVFPADKVKVLADNFEGKAFGRPNDLVIDKNQVVYFTDSGAQARPDQPAPTSAVAKPAVYRISAAGALTRIAADIERPNGIQLSPDEKVLYVANTNGEYVLAYDIGKDGAIGPRRSFARLDGVKPTETGITSGADGLAVDSKGRVYVATSLGIQVFSDHGKALGIIALPKQPQNLAFAGAGKRTLYAVGRGAAYKIAVLTPGYKGRAK
ncbi:MAG: SMP-30/Gluconolaconase/LRE domain protein [Hydrocarboniphaga sp.]|nr:SMP-30/Gluconolaconase/LRE domain protein [Hydrocarboniphaga sp.]